MLSRDLQRKSRIRHNYTNTVADNFYPVPLQHQVKVHQSITHKKTSSPKILTPKALEPNKVIQKQNEVSTQQNGFSFDLKETKSSEWTQCEILSPVRTDSSFKDQVSFDEKAFYEKKQNQSLQIGQDNYEVSPSRFHQLLTKQISEGESMLNGFTKTTT